MCVEKVKYLLMFLGCFYESIVSRIFCYMMFLKELIIKINLWVVYFSDL